MAIRAPLRRGLCAALGAIVLTCGIMSDQVRAQEAPLGQLRSPVLVLDFEQLYMDSAFGRKIAAEVQAGRTELAAENREIEAELTQEERLLTDQRPTLDPDAFRVLADAFDEKVRSIRREQDEKARRLSRRQEGSRDAFLTAAIPVLQELMREAGAAVVLEQRSVFLSLNAIDITRDAVARIDAVIGDGRMLDTPSDPAPDATPRQP